MTIKYTKIFNVYVYRNSYYFARSSCCATDSHTNISLRCFRSCLYCDNSCTVWFCWIYCYLICICRINSTIYRYYKCFTSFCNSSRDFYSNYNKCFICCKCCIVTICTQPDYTVCIIFTKCNFIAISRTCN